MKKFALGVCGVLALGSTAAAQVGHLPSRSPYRDLEFAQELSIVGGSFVAHRDPARAAPEGGALVGVHYEWRAGGPAHLIGDLSAINSQRNVLNPFAIGAARNLGTTTRPLYSGTVGLGLSLTGAKSWHGFVPEVSGGLGFITDFHSKPDSGGFKFGTRFALNMGAGIRWVPGGRWQVRADVVDRLYTISYPEAYYVAPSGGTAVLSSVQAKSFWTNNPAFTLGLSRLF